MKRRIGTPTLASYSAVKRCSSEVLKFSFQLLGKGSGPKRLVKYRLVRRHPLYACGARFLPRVEE